MKQISSYLNLLFIPVCFLLLGSVLLAESAVSLSSHEGEKISLLQGAQERYGVNDKRGSDEAMACDNVQKDMLLWRVLAGVLVVGFFLLYRQYVLSRYNKQLQEEVLRKLDELRKKDELLVQKLRMAAMGEMLSMIAHQWRQPLSAISSTLIGVDLRLKLDRYDMSDERERKAFFAFLEERHQKIREYTEFLSHTIDDFRHFYSPHKEKRISVVTEPVERALVLMAETFSENGIVVKTEFDSRESVPMFRNEVMQVILNVLKNSEDNFAHRGTAHPHIRISTHSTQESVHIAICDNGGGVPEEILPKIFEPYFSTKEEQQGVGLGLYMSRVIIEKHHAGTLTVENTREGACFTIALPKQ